MICCLVISSITCISDSKVNASTKALSLEEAIQEAIKVSPEMALGQTNLRQKTVEFSQTLRSVSQQAAKDRSSFAEPSQLSQDIDWKMKNPTATKNLKEARDNLRQIEREVAQDVKKMYLDTVQAMLQEGIEMKKRTDKQQELSQMRALYRMGAVKKDELEEAEENLKIADSSVKLAQLTYKTKIIELGKKTGLSLEVGFTFGFQPEHVILTQELMWRLIRYAELNSVSFNQIVENRKLQEQKVKVTRDLYIRKFGSAEMRVIESMYTSQSLDHDQFMASYELMLNQIKRSWEGFTLLGGILPIPKFIIQGKYDGLRYFDEDILSLPVSTLELEKQRKTEAKAREELVLGIQKAYLDTKTIEENYAQALRNVDIARDQLKSAESKRKAGLLTKEKYQEVLDNLDEKEQIALNGLFSYLSGLMQLNAATSGGLNQHIRKGILPYQRINDGLEPTQPPASPSGRPTGKWEVQSIVEDVLSEFKLEINSGFNATHYRLVTVEGSSIGERVPINQSIKHLHFVFNTLDQLRILFFKDTTVIAESLLDGYGTEGALQITLIEDGKSTIALNPQLQQGNDEASNNELNLSKLSNGNIIIGTTLLSMHSLNEDIYQVALASMEETIQGMYYKSELAKGAWVNIQDVLDISDIVSPSREKIISSDQLNSMEIKLWVDPSGAMASQMSVTQLTTKIDDIQNSLERLELQYETAVDQNDSILMTETMTRIEEKKAEELLMEKLRDQGGILAFSDYKDILTPITIQRLVAESNARHLEKLQAQLNVLDNEEEKADIQNQIAQLLGELPAVVPSLDQQLDGLSAEINNMSLLLNSAKDLNNTEKVKEFYTDLIRLEARLSYIEGRFEAEEESLAKAKEITEQAYLIALSQGDPQSIELQKMMLEIKKQQQILKILEAYIDKQILEDKLLGTGNSNEIINFLKEKFNLSIQNIKDKQIELYTENDQILLKNVSETLKKTYNNINVLAIDSVISNKVFFKLDMPPVILNNRVFIQARPLAESLGATVIWNSSLQTITINKNDITIFVQINNGIANVNGVRTRLDIPPQLLLGKTVLPLRFIAESLGMSVTYDATTETIEIY